jgi:hypothetical protein
MNITKKSSLIKSIKSYKKTYGSLRRDPFKTPLFKILNSFFQCLSSKSSNIWLLVDLIIYAFSITFLMFLKIHICA